jgi:hypothetical protein
MNVARLFSTFALTSLLFASACATDAEDPAPEQSDSTTRIHMLPLHSPDAKLAHAAPAGAHLTYWGGPVLANIDVHPVYWRSTTQFQSNLNAFYNAVTGSALWSMLSQYGIGPGSGVAGIVDNRTTTNVSDAAVQAELNRLFTNGIPQPNANRYYPVHFPAGVRITAPDGSQSCVQFCAYHGTYVRNGVNVNYGVIPDIGQAGCNGGCGGNTVQNNTDSVASHELVEATTDPAVGLATVFGPPLGWYDPNNGEIGDICNGQQGTTVGRDNVTYTIQLEFSNAANNCVAR